MASRFVLALLTMSTMPALSDAAQEIQDPVIPETQIVIAAVGDVIPHSPLQRQADRSHLGYRSLWRDLEPLFAKADLVYANLETPVAPRLTARGRLVPASVRSFDGVAYTGYPMFNAPPRLAFDLAAAGVDVVSTANNHSLDRGRRGIDMTLKVLASAGLAYTGTRPTSAGADWSWHVVTEAKGYRIAWLACTYGTNGLPDRRRQVLHCFGRPDILSVIRTLAGREDIDAVILTPHFGQEYAKKPSPRQRRFARRAIEAGAVAVIGSHPHLVQPWEWWRASDGRDGFILYSLGNFVSNQQGVRLRSSLILLLGVGRTVSGAVGVAGVRHIPIAMLKKAAANGSAVRPTTQAVRYADRHTAARVHDAMITGILGPEDRHDPQRPLTTLRPGPLVFRTLLGEGVRGRAGGGAYPPSRSGGASGGYEGGTRTWLGEGPAAPSTGLTAVAVEGPVVQGTDLAFRFAVEGPAAPPRLLVPWIPDEGPVPITSPLPSFLVAAAEGQAAPPTAWGPTAQEGPFFGYRTFSGTATSGAAPGLLPKNGQRRNGKP